MSWGSPVFAYCERGQDPSLWAEPLNALSNAAFLAVALVAAIRLRRSASERASPALWSLIVLTATIGVGSTTFHLVATRAARLADLAPIAIFIGAYLAHVLRDWLGWSRVATATALLALAVASAAVAVPCAPSGALVSAESAPCLNGSAGYLPALAGLVMLTAVVARARHPGATRLSAAAVLFAAALAFRTVDLWQCPLLQIGAVRLGAHTIWHLLNAAVLHLVLGAAIAAATVRPTLQNVGARR